MSKKEFQKKFVHPTRRKLVDMVHTGKYDKDTKISQTTGKKKEEHREIGDEWEDSTGNIWVQRDGYKVKKSKNTDTLSQVRRDIESKLKCSGDTCDKKGRYGSTDKQLIKEVGYCTNCLIDREVPIRSDGNYETYTRYRMFCKLFIEGETFLDKLKDAKKEAKQEYQYVDGDGKTQTWTLERPVEELKEEIQEEIDITKGQLEEVEEKMKELYGKLKDFNYELVEKIKTEIEDD